MSPPTKTARNARILELRDTGMSYSDIAAAIGVTWNVVSGVLMRARHYRHPKPALAPAPSHIVVRNGVSLPRLKCLEQQEDA